MLKFRRPTRDVDWEELKQCRFALSTLGDWVYYRTASWRGRRSLRSCPGIERRSILSRFGHGAEGLAAGRCQAPTPAALSPADAGYSRRHHLNLAGAHLWGGSRTADDGNCLTSSGASWPACRQRVLIMNLFTVGGSHKSSGATMLHPIILGVSMPEPAGVSGNIFDIDLVTSAS